MNHPLLLALLTGAGLYLAWLWRADLRATAAGSPPRGALPGATTAPTRAIAIAVAGGLILLLIETAGEIALGIAGDQSRMTWLFAAYAVLAAPVIEELVFRGWLVLETRGKAVMWTAALVASVVFAAVHPFLWRWDDNRLLWTPSPKGWFTTAILFATSLWLYVARLAPWNPRRSLLPCFAAHAAKNLGVVAIKATSGFMAGAW